MHYLPLPEDQPLDPSIWRAGAHTDFDCLTMVFQQEGQGGLQVSPGRGTEGKGEERAWYSVTPKDGLITCNIGDMLMRWSDDRLKSTLHRVRMPRPGEPRGARYSMAFFCQANKDEIIQGPEKKYPPISAGIICCNASRPISRPGGRLPPEDKAHGRPSPCRCFSVTVHPPENAAPSRPLPVCALR